MCRTYKLRPGNFLLHRRSPGRGCAISPNNCAKHRQTQRHFACMKSAQAHSLFSMLLKSAQNLRNCRKGCPDCRRRLTRLLITKWWQRSHSRYTDTSFACSETRTVQLITIIGSMTRSTQGAPLGALDFSQKSCLACRSALQRLCGAAHYRHISSKSALACM